MKLAVLACLAAGLAPAADYSYVVLNHSGFYSLVRVSAQGRYLETIANGFTGADMTKDRAGNYLIVTVHGLMRVSPAGKVGQVLPAPPGSQWMKVVLGPDDSAIVADNKQHALWRVSADGQSVAKIANYAVARAQELEDVGLALDGQGNYVLIEDNGRDVRLYRIAPSGEVTQLPLRGDLGFSPVLFADGAQGYLAEQGRGAALVRIAAGGEVTPLANFGPGMRSVTGIVRDPATGDYLATVRREQAILRIRPDGSTTTVAYSPTFLVDPQAILVENGR